MAVYQLLHIFPQNIINHLFLLENKLKLYGTQKLIEDIEYKFTDRCVILDDVITSGNSLQKTIDIMQDKVNIVDIGVIINRQENPQCSLPVKLSII